MLVSAPDMTMGRNRGAAWIAVRPWTVWKYSVMKYWRALKTAQQKKTAIQVQVKTRLVRQREFGMITGRLSRSWRLAQRMKPGISAIARQRRVRLAGWMRRAVLAVTVLTDVSR